PLGFLKEPLRWLSAISRFGGTHSAGPNFAYQLCVDRIDEAQCEGLDLSSWRVASNGAGPIRRRTLESSAKKFALHGFDARSLFGSYGLAEATLLVSSVAAPKSLRIDSAAYEKHRVVEARPGNPFRELVSCGRPGAPVRVAIASLETGAAAPPNEVGEIWVADASVAKGYFENAGASKETFGARLAGTNEGPFLRTGDLGFFHAGELYVSGRQKDLIILGGRNHYPQDLELCAEEAHSGVRRGCVAAFSVEVDGAEAAGRGRGV